MMLTLLMAMVAQQENSAPPTPEKFDLVCTGTTTVVAVNKVTGTEPADIHLRIDLNTKVWCGGVCSRTFPIDGVITPSEIVLIDSDHDQFSSQNHGDITFESHLNIDRATGVMLSSNYIISYGHLRSGRSTEAMCKPVSFSGMPKAMF